MTLTGKLPEVITSTGDQLAEDVKTVDEVNFSASRFKWSPVVPQVAVDPSCAAEHEPLQAAGKSPKRRLRRCRPRVHEALVRGNVPRQSRLWQSSRWHSEPNWVRWVVKTYEGSTKPEHRKFLKFIELMIEMEEKGATPTSIEMLREHQARQEPVMPLRTKAKAIPCQPVQETDLLVHLAEGSQEEWINMSSDISTDENIEALQARMTNVENALTEILNHVRQAPQ